LSFPFCKSLLMMYYNIDVLERAGIKSPPRTWIEMVESCRRVRELDGVTPWALSVDASTVAALVYSMGGDVYDEAAHKTLFASPAARAAFDVIEQVTKGRLIDYVAPRSFDDVSVFASGRSAFLLKSSTSRPYIDRDVQDTFRWDATAIPHADPGRPATVLYGPDLCIFRSTPAQQLVAWQFTKFLASVETTADWATQTGYVPLRRSAAELPVMQSFFADKAVNRRAFDIIPYARPEPNIAGWQRIRELVENAQTAILTETMTAAEAAEFLQRESDLALADYAY